MFTERVRRIRRSRRHQDEVEPGHTHHADPTHVTPENVLELQHTYGNHFVSQLATIQRLSVQGTQWKSVDEVRKSAGGGVNPVFFMGSGGQEVVVKALADGGAAMQFANDIYGTMVETPQTRVIQMDSKEGKQILAAIEAHLPAAQVRVTMEILKDFTVFVIMEKKNLASLESFITEAQPNKKRGEGNASFDTLLRKMFHGGFFQQLGRIHATDIFLGNRDRLDPGMTQLQNIFISLDSGSSLGMDLDVRAASMDTVKKNTYDKRNTQGIAGHEYKDWVRYAIEGQSAMRDVENKKTGAVTQEEIGSVGSSMGAANFTHLTDQAALDKIIDDLKAGLVRGFGAVRDKDEGKRRLNQITGGDDAALQQAMDQKWGFAKRDFKAGVQEAMAQISAGMQSGDYKKLFDKAVKAQGKDPQFDFVVFQIRAMYWKVKQEHPDIPYNVLLVMLEEYAKFLHTGQGKNPFLAAVHKPAAKPAPVASTSTTKPAARK